MSEKKKILKPCPFCGGNPFVYKNGIHIQVICQRCSGSTAFRITEGQVYDAWNKREGR